MLPAGWIHCPVCIIGKSRRINPLSSTCREIECLDITAVDLIGPFQVDLVKGSKYIMAMRDVATGYCFVCILTHKWEATTQIMEIINWVENFTEKKVKWFQATMAGRLPQYGIFRVFGSVGYAHVPPKLQKKLDPRAQRGQVVAYLGPSKG
ncbi:hypothetical protein PCASD_24969 [Puccinia coronata f. sp. avenae]|uniref:Integrase catalytic domain-containing protein n=1 Tax=Puccinia coronata f. sp. avenae TaxID=200324 RepID=A0A2N5T193_9BASI|nr:hypothetical protein PCASD_24969 [Puccinia coronata f. sp. avenae]